jgi:hypothetical protein
MNNGGIFHGAAQGFAQSALKMGVGRRGQVGILIFNNKNKWKSIVAPTHRVSESELLTHFRILHSFFTGLHLVGNEQTRGGWYSTTPNYSWAKDPEIKLPIFLLAVQFTKVWW